MTVLIRYIMLFILIAVSVIRTAAQSPSRESERLSALYQEFQYQEVIRQGEAYLGQKTDLRISEKCEILRLVALSYYATQNMQGALKNFSQILTYDENYRLDPVKNPPKILAFFEEIRHQYFESQPIPNAQKNDSLAIAQSIVFTDSIKSDAYQQMALSFVLPGSGQINRGQKVKGWLLVTGNFALLGASIYFAAETDRLSDHYLQVTDQSKISAAYDRYDNAYRKRNLALSGFLLIWVYTQLDFIFLSPPSKHPPAVSLNSNIYQSGKTELSLSIMF